MQLRVPATWVSLLLCLSVHAEDVSLGSHAAKIVPEQVAVLTLSERGIVTDFADPGSRLQQGAVIARVNKDKLEQEKEDMELQLARERIIKKDELRKLEAEKRKIEFYLNLTDGERKFAKDLMPSSGETPTPDSLADLKERMDLLKRELSTLERRKRTEWESKNESCTLKMPFDGRLQYNVTLPQDKSKPFENTGMVHSFATACDDSAYYITISINRSEFTQLPAENFRAEVKLPANRILRGSYAFRRVERSHSGGDMLVYFFKLPAEDHEVAHTMLGSNARATLIYNAGEGVQRVRKAALAAHPEASRCENWEELVAVAYPGYNIVIIAERDIIISPDSAPAASDRP